MNLPNVLMIGKDPLSGECEGPTPACRSAWAVPSVWTAVSHSSGYQLRGSAGKHVVVLDFENGLSS